MTVVETSYGQLQGEQGEGVAVFRGIPFAKPPVGDLRFRAPEPPEPWDGVRDATAFGPVCPQVVQAGNLITEGVENQSEDCLYLNVWTPSTEGSRPVMVWIHGGAFVIGAGSQPMYDGATLSREGDVVVVSINYRLGLFGYLRGKDLGAEGLDSTGNEAGLDQVAALRWVRDEIAAFGGDPEQVTVFGESAGSISIAVLLGTPVARGLFQRAILQSGSANAVTTPDAATEVARKVLEHLEVAPAEAGRLRELTTEQLLEAQSASTPFGMGGLAYAPVIDGEVVPRSPFEAVADGEVADVALIGGTMRDEMKLFAFMDMAVFNLDDAALLERVEAQAPGKGAHLVAAYRAAREARGAPVTNFELWSAVMSDWMFRVPELRLLELQAAHNPDVYCYLFTQESPALGGMMGSPHALDIPFVFGTHSGELVKAFVGEGDQVEALSRAVRGAWLAFARTGAPSHEGLPAWPRYEPGRRSTMEFGPELRVVEAPLEAERLAWSD